MGVIALLLLRGQTMRPTGKDQTTDIGVEHSSALHLGMSFTTGSGEALLEVSHDGSGTVLLSLPSSWKMRAIRYARIQDVPFEPITFSFRRWHLPPKVVLSLVLPSPPTNLRINNASLVPMELSVKRINLQTDTAISDTYLVKDTPLLLP